MAAFQRVSAGTQFGNFPGWFDVAIRSCGILLLPFGSDPVWAADDLLAFQEIQDGVSPLSSSCLLAQSLFLVLEVPRLRQLQLEALKTTQPQASGYLGKMPSPWLRGSLVLATLRNVMTPTDPHALLDGPTFTDRDQSASRDPPASSTPTRTATTRRIATGRRPASRFDMYVPRFPCLLLANRSRSGLIRLFDYDAPFDPTTRSSPSASSNPTPTSSTTPTIPLPATPIPTST